MATYMQTMFVHYSPPQFPRSPQPLPAIQSDVLAESASSLHLLSELCVPDHAYYSPLQRQLQMQMHDGSGMASGLEESRLGHGEYRNHEAQRGLGFNLAYVAKKADLLTRSNSNARTKQAFQPQKRGKATTSLQLKQFAEATLGSGSLKKVVQLPEGEDRDEWIAVNGKS